MTTHFSRLSGLLLCTLLMGTLSACSGGDSSASQEQQINRTADAETPAQAETAVPADEQIILDENSEPLLQTTGGIYQRAAEYPKAVNLPLQFIDTINGKKLGVRVTLPADEHGNPAPGPFPVILTQSAYNTNLLSLMLLASLWGKSPAEIFHQFCKKELDWVICPLRSVRKACPSMSTFVGNGSRPRSSNCLSRPGP